MIKSPWRRNDHQGDTQVQVWHLARPQYCWLLPWCHSEAVLSPVGPKIIRKHINNQTRSLWDCDKNEVKQGHFIDKDKVPVEPTIYQTFSSLS